MDGWKITFSPGGVVCGAKWVTVNGETKACGEVIKSGYVVAQHANYPGEKMCMACMVASVRSFLRERELE